MIGIFGGAFDPVHFGHIKNAQTAVYELELDKLIIMPYHASSDKNKPLFDNNTRVKMLQIALGNKKNIVIDKQEVIQNKITYTIDALRDIKKTYYKQNIYLLLGMDSFNSIKNWRCYSEFSKLCNIVIFSRPNNVFDNKSANNYFKTTNKLSAIKNSKHGLVYILTNNNITTSSSDIRYKIVKKQNLSGLMPDSIIKYLTSNYNDF